MTYLIGFVLALLSLGVLSVRRAAVVAADDVRAARRMVARLRARLEALPADADEERARLTARLGDVERVEVAFRDRRAARFGGWRRPLLLGLHDDPK